MKDTKRFFERTAIKLEMLFKEEIGEDEFIFHMLEDHNTPAKVLAKDPLSISALVEFKFNENTFLVEVEWRSYADEMIVRHNGEEKGRVRSGKYESYPYKDTPETEEEEISSVRDAIAADVAEKRRKEEIKTNTNTIMTLLESEMEVKKEAKGVLEEAITLLLEKQLIV